MSQVNAYQWAASRGLLPMLSGKPEPKPKIMKRFKLNWFSLLNPDGYWLHPHGLERGLLIFSHLVRTAQPFVKDYVSGPIELLSMKPTCVNFRDVSPICSIADLRERFHYALAYPSGGQNAQWRGEHHIAVTETVVIGGRHYEPFHLAGESFTSENEAQVAFDKLLATTDVKLNTSLNDCHRKAVWAHSVELRFGRHGSLQFVLEFGYRRDSSSWYHELARQAKGEPPYLTLRRAIESLAMLTKELAKDEPKVARVYV